MRLWTVQSNRSFVRLNRDGVLYCDSQETKGYLDDVGTMARAYVWMMDQMERRLPVQRPAMALYPIWAWAQVGSYKKEYHPSSYEYDHGQDVMLELDVPDEHVLLSDYQIWYCVLNEFSTGVCPEMEKRLDRFLDMNGRVLLKDYPQDLHDYVVSSWERCFDLDYRDKNFSQMRRNRKIQATMWQLRSEWVTGYMML